jgi:hypothetical protein
MIGVARSLRTSCVFIRLWGSAVAAAEEAAGHVVMVGDGVEVLVGRRSMAFPATLKFYSRKAA